MAMQPDNYRPISPQQISPQMARMALAEYYAQQSDAMRNKAYRRKLWIPWNCLMVGVDSLRQAGYQIASEVNSAAASLSRRDTRS